MKNQNVALPYFMSYPAVGENTAGRKEISDRDYFRQMYPTGVKRYLRVIAEVLDRMEEPQSYIYDEYPDKVRMDRLAEIVLGMIPLENYMSRETQRNIVKVLLWEEVIYRRNQYRNRNLLP